MNSDYVWLCPQCGIQARWCRCQPDCGLMMCGCGWHEADGVQPIQSTRFAAGLEADDDD